jgi:hypothetical protein
MQIVVWRDDKVEGQERSTLRKHALSADCDFPHSERGQYVVLYISVSVAPKVLHRDERV